VQLHRDRDRFEAAGARLVLIGMGTPAQAAGFRSSYGLDLPLLVDPERKAYAAAGTRVTSMRKLISPGVIARGVSHAIRSRVSQGSIKQSPTQLGAVLIVLPDGSIPYGRLSGDPSDHPPNDEVLAALTAARMPSSRRASG
jgi:peroxiredoxin